MTHDKDYGFLLALSLLCLIIFGAIVFQKVDAPIRAPASVDDYQVEMMIPSEIRQSPDLNY